ncbi:MAG: choice-of-anchor R domain-containing protein [Chthoniobacterales bacterium]
MKLHCLKFALAAALILGMAPDSEADVMVTNLTEPTFSTFPVSSWWAGNRFITDNSAPSFLLDSVTVKMDTADAMPGNFFVAIYSHATDGPGTLLQTLTGNTNPATAGDYTYTSSGLSLAPNTSYWVVTGVSSGGVGGSGYLWKLSGDPFNFTGPWTIPATDTHITSIGAGGENWRTDLPHDAYPRQFSVSATAVPEPAVFVLVGLGVVTLLLRRRARA